MLRTNHQPSAIHWYRCNSTKRALEWKNLTETDSYQFLNQGILVTAAGKIVVPSSRREKLLKLFHDHVVDLSVVTDGFHYTT